MRNAILILGVSGVSVALLPALLGKARGDDAPLEVVGNAGFEEGKVGGSVPAWMTFEPYKSQISDQNPKAGAHCARLELAAKTKPNQFGALNQWLNATSFQGKRVRFRAAVRTEVEGEGNQAQLWFRVDRPKLNGGPVVGAFDNMQDRPIKKGEWQYYEIVGDVADDAKTIAIGLLLIGQGKVWLDDVTFEVVGDEVATTARQIAGTPGAMRNPDFEQGKAGGLILGWHVPTSVGFEASLSDNAPKGGKLCARMRRDMNNGKLAAAGIVQPVSATAYHGKRVRYRAAVRAEVEGETNQGQLWLRVDQHKIHDRRITSGEWEYYDIEVDVPQDAQYITLGVLIVGQGEVWIDDVSLEVVGDDA